MPTPVQPAAHAVAAYQTYRLNFARNKNRLWPPLDSFSVLGLLSKFVVFLFLCFSSPIDCNCLNQHKVLKGTTKVMRPQRSFFRRRRNTQIANTSTLRQTSTDKILHCHVSQCKDPLTKIRDAPQLARA